MATSKNISFGFVLLIVVIFSCCTSFVLAKVHVSIINGLGPGNALYLHCRDKHTDLGEQTVHYNQNFEWSFSENVFDTTLYWCRIWWYDHHKIVSINHEIYNGGKDTDAFHGSCGDYKDRCIRKAQWDGLYYLMANGRFEK
ncbi:hypothetical protein FRX31_034394, partial [Thalictrum thalictroides]